MKIRIMTLAGLALCGMAGGIAHGQQAAPTLMYSQTFEGGLNLPEWSSNTVYTTNTHWHTFTNFNGRYSNGYTILRLSAPEPLPAGVPALPPDSPPSPPGDGGSDGGGQDGNPGGPTQPPAPPQPQPAWRVYTVTFDLYILDSWDGDEPTLGIDRFRLSVNDILRFEQSFTNQPGNVQGFRAPDVGPAFLGFNSVWRDSIYRNIAVDFQVPEGEDLRIRFHDSGNLQGLNDESWGIDNVRVSYRIVPAPSTAMLGLLAGTWCLRRRR